MRLLLLLLSACATVGDKPLAIDLGRPYARCSTTLRSAGIDVVAENMKAAALAETLRARHGMAFDAIIVPGYSAPSARTNAEGALHPFAKERLLRAVLDFRKRLAPFFILTGGSVGHGANEALAMKRYLTSGGIPEERIFIEPCARHSHTNLRNSGRLLLSHGLGRGLIVTSYDQAFYFSTGWLTGFWNRSRKQLGYQVGDLQRYDAQRVSFVPSRTNFTVGSDPEDP